MCLAIPGKIVDSEEIGGFRVGNVRFGGITRKVYLDFVPEAGPGDYVIVHVGFAISRVDAEEAERTFALLEEMGALKDEGVFEKDGPS
jgi:hydrogenase expression/formation protein HypC